MLDAHAHVMQVKLCKANTRGVTATPARSGRWRKAKCGHYLGSPAQRRDGRARGGYNRAMGSLEAVIMRWRVR